MFSDEGCFGWGLFHHTSFVCFFSPSSSLEVVADVYVSYCKFLELKSVDSIWFWCFSLAQFQISVFGVDAFIFTFRSWSLLIHSSIINIHQLLCCFFSHTRLKICLFQENPFFFFIWLCLSYTLWRIDNFQ